MGLLLTCLAVMREIHLSFLAAYQSHKRTQLELFNLSDKILPVPPSSGPWDVGCVYQNQTVGCWYGIHSAEVPGYHKWSRHVTIMASRFPIWAPHRELSCKNVSVEFQVATSSAITLLCQIPNPKYHIDPSLQSILTVITTMLVCVLVLCCHVRCMCHVRGAMSPGMALVDLRQLYALILCADRMGCSSWECTLTSMGGARSAKVRAKERSDLLHCA